MPTLRCGDTVTINNLLARKGNDVGIAIEAAGATLRCLPPYFPHFNAIKNAFSGPEAVLCKAAARTIDNIWTVIRDVLPCFTIQDYANYVTVAKFEPD